jgi:hypothetical protein
VRATSNGTSDRGVFAGGLLGTPQTYYNIIDYITISTTGDAQDFGDLSSGRTNLAATSNGTGDKGFFAGGYELWPVTQVNIIDSITISSTGNASDFGDLTVKRHQLAATSDGV